MGNVKVILENFEEIFTKSRQFLRSFEKFYEILRKFYKIKKCTKF